MLLPARLFCPGPERESLRNLLYFWAGDQEVRGERPRLEDARVKQPAVETDAPAAVALTTFRFCHCRFFSAASTAKGLSGSMGFSARGGRAV